MKCNFCGQEYEFSLGHRCLVMQEESKQPMPQPDLVSKLREFVRAHNYGYLNPSEEGKPGHYWCLCGWEGPDRGSYWKHLDEALLAESLLGLEGQAAPLVEGCAEHNIPLVDGRCPKCRDANGNTFVLDMQSKTLLPSPSTPIVPGTPDDPRFDGVVVEVAEEFAILDEDIPRLREILGRLPGTAGLSADWPECKDFFDLMQYYRHAPVTDQPFTVKRYELVKEWLRAQVNALLGAERPAPAGEVRSGWEQGYDRAIREALEAGLPQLEWANIHGSRCEELLRWVKDLLRLSPAGEAKVASK